MSKSLRSIILGLILAPVFILGIIFFLENSGEEAAIKRKRNSETKFNPKDLVSRRLLCEEESQIGGFRVEMVCGNDMNQDGKPDSEFGYLVFTNVRGSDRPISFDHGVFFQNEFSGSQPIFSMEDSSHSVLSSIEVSPGNSFKIQIPIWRDGYKTESTFTAGSGSLHSLVRSKKNSLMQNNKVTPCGDNKTISAFGINSSIACGNYFANSEESGITFISNARETTGFYGHYSISDDFKVTHAKKISPDTSFFIPIRNRQIEMRFTLYQSIK